MSPDTLLPFGLLPVLLAADGEGRAFLDQLGMVSEGVVDRPKDDPALSEVPTAEPSEAEHVRAVILGVQVATHRLTWVADLPERLSSVFFVGDQVTIGIAFLPGGFSPQVLDGVGVATLLAAAVDEADAAEVHWSLGRWRGSECEVVVREEAGSIVVGGEVEDLAARARSAKDLATLVDVVVGSEESVGAILQ